MQEDALREFFAMIDNALDLAMFTHMLRCGLRISEIARLELSDLYLEEETPRMLVRGKGSRQRVAYLSDQAVHVLQECLSARSTVACEYVFLSYQMNGLTTHSIHMRLLHYRELAGLTLTAHRLRHSFANDLLNADVPITSIQKLMGHRWIETTQIYVAANDKQVQADIHAASHKLQGWA